MRRRHRNTGIQRPRKYRVLGYREKGYVLFPYAYVNLKTAVIEARRQIPSLVITINDEIKTDQEGFVDLDSVTIVQKIEPEIEVQF